MRKKPKNSLKQHYKKAVELGLIGALSIVLLFFLAFRTVQLEGQVVVEAIPDIKVEQVPLTEQVKRQPPPPRPSVAIPSEDEDIPADETIDPTGFDFAEIPPPPPPPVLDESSATFVPYDEPPVPVGGYAAIQRNLKYPEFARRAGVEGRVHLNVHVDVDGTVLEVQVTRSMGFDACDEAAVAAVRSVKWKPALQRDRPVRVWLALPIDFRLR